MSLSSFMKFSHRSLYQITLLFATEPDEVIEAGEHLPGMAALWDVATVEERYVGDAWKNND